MQDPTEKHCCDVGILGKHEVNNNNNKVRVFLRMIFPRIPAYSATRNFRQTSVEGFRGLNFEIQLVKKVIYSTQN